MSRSYFDDRAYGIASEGQVIDILSKHYREIIQKVHNRYSPYDAVSKTSKYEIKTRRCSVTEYPTTIVPTSKVKYLTSKLIFVFQFTDGLYSIVYDRELFDTFETMTIQLSRDGINDQPTEHYCIPVSQLLQIGIY